MSSEGQFVRVLDSREVLALAFGAMIGWGWVVLAGGWVNTAGSIGAMVGFGIGGVAVVLIGLAYAEMAAAMPLAGGEHVYSYRAFGLAGSFLCTWSIILCYVSVVAFEAVALPTVLEELIPGYKMGLMWNFAGGDVYFTWVLVGVAGAVVMTWINVIGMKSSALLQKVVTLLILVVGIMLMTGALFNGSHEHMEPLFNNGMTGIIGVLLMTPFMFVGFDVIPQAAEEINLPYRQIGRILVLSVIMAVAWYVGVILAVSLALSAEDSAASQLPTVDAMRVLFGGAWAGNLLILAGIGGIITSWNAFLIGGSRAIYSMAHAKMLPAFLGRMHPKYNTPVNAILFIGVLSLVAPFFGRKTMVWLVDAGGLGIVVAWGAVAASFLVLRKREPDMPRPFVVSHPAVGWGALILAIGIVLLYMPGVSPAALVWPYEWGIVLTWIALGFLFYYWSRMAHPKGAGDRVMQAQIDGLADIVGSHGQPPALAPKPTPA